MFLKSLTLKGFKSFADSTMLEFEPGITVVVGPNGSGKSNVVDAIAWVLGAQAPTAVRSQKMDDVIFAGTAKRPALGRAEVVLTIDNSAGALPIDFTEVTITRTLFRSGDSEYAINGVPCRLLDVTELLSDSGVGRQQHVIVSQGQIDAVLNARPEDRRLIIEEAAGVLKYRRRKERAERRLAATEGNLLRMQDLLREVRRQLRPLERQAEAARRHGDVVAELDALRLHLAGRELAALRTRLEAERATQAGLARDGEALRVRLARLDAEVTDAEIGLAALGGDDVGDALVRFESLRERARGLLALLAERGRGVERDRGALADREVIAALESEAARIRAELDSVEADSVDLAPELDRLAADEAALAADRERFATDWGDGVPAPSGRAAEVRGELAALRRSLERADADAAGVADRIVALEVREADLAGEAGRLRAELAAAEAAEEPLVVRLDEAERRRRTAEGMVVEVRDRRAAALGDRQRWDARAEALALALDEARAAAGAEQLVDVPGIVGTLLDVVEVDPGWEAAFEAAAGDALGAVVVADVAAGRRALDALHAGAARGAVLALGAGRPDPALAVAAGEAVRDHVRATRPDVDALLDALLGHAVAVEGGWAVAVDLALAHPELVVVTRDGDRFGATGWRIGVAGSGATGAALDEARGRVVAAGEELTALEGEIDRAERELEAAREAESVRARELDDNDGRLSAAGDALSRIETERRDVATEAATLRERVGELVARTDRERARTEELDATLPMLDDEEQDRVERGRALAAARARLEERISELASHRRALEVRGASMEQRRALHTARLAELEQRLARDLDERRRAESRRTELDRRARATGALAALVGRRVATVEAELAELHERRRRQSDATRRVGASLDDARRRRTEVERLLAEQRERSGRAELAEAETRLRLDAALESLRRDLDVDPDTAIAAPAPEVPEGSTPIARSRELERELRLMGPVNPLALEEFEALQERHAFLESQLDDVKSTRRDLAKVIRAVDGEIVNVFAAAFADVAANFEHLFHTLFPGGRGGLRLTDPDDLLNTGIEVDARPSGKNVRKLSLLSGGERSLTALAYLFAVFRSRPSPFYVMDEVEAALDDVNLHRFLDLIHEFRAEAQLIVVSHQKRTMEAADCLYGVTMQPGGSSRVVAERVTATT